VAEQLDIIYQDHGSIILMIPETDAARDWVADHLPDDAQRFGAGICIEPRYFGDIAYGAQEDGLTSNVTVEPRQ
jgi:anti-sigma regulatory factor (Ser/Thr protein kinase)